MTDGYPLGADSDTDAIRAAAADAAFAKLVAMTEKLGLYPVSSPCRGDRAADIPGTGGAPNHKEDQS